MSASPPPDPARIELLACAEDPAYFLDRHASIYDATAADWVPFRLWPAQAQTLDTILGHRLVVILKARQLGLTWLVLGFALWEMLFRPAATVLLFSRRDDEAVDLLRTRLRGMYDRLPAWLRVRSFPVDNDHEWQWSNGSRVLAFPTTAGDSYTASLAVVDEADLVPDLDRVPDRPPKTPDFDAQDPERTLTWLAGLDRRVGYVLVGEPTADARFEPKSDAEHRRLRAALDEFLKVVRGLKGRKVSWVFAVDKVAREKGQTVLRVRHLVGPEARPGMDYCLKVRPASFSLWEDIGFPVEAGGLLAKLRPGARVLVTGRITRVNVGRITIASQNYRPVIPEGDRMCFWFYVQLQDWQVRLARAGGRLW